jgi:hypothetical protein
MKRLLTLLVLVCGIIVFVRLGKVGDAFHSSSFFQSDTWTSLQDTIQNKLNSLASNPIQPSDSANRQTTNSANPETLLQIRAGDDRISEQTIQEIASIVHTISYPTLKSAINQPFQKPVEIWLYSSALTYRHALVNSGVDTQQARLMTRETGGIAQGNRILIPLYQTDTKAEMVNVLTHELTHVALNQLGIGNELPTWINEGLAWQEGLTAEQQVDPQRVRAERAQIQQSILHAYKAGELLPLSSDEQTILSAKYNVEAEDYLAVEYLERTYGVDKLNQFLNTLHRDALPAWMPVKQSESEVYKTFENVYHMTFETFEKQFLDSLTR